MENMYKRVIAVFDIGKTNKKLLLLDEDYSVIFEKTARLEEAKDEDGFPCENVQALINFMEEALEEAIRYKYYKIVALNFSAYGASFVYLDEHGKVICSLYNYLKPYPEELQKKFYSENEGEVMFSALTSSPVLGSLNSGMQLYRLKNEKPEVFKKIKTALHLPQFLSYIFTNKAVSEITSIGCHTNLWNFSQNDYHAWVSRESIDEKLAPIADADKTIEAKYDGHSIKVGTGLHDSSAALIPYLMSFKKPFVLLSTGTWCISLNPFNTTPLTADELRQDALCYLTYNGTPVKASRLLLGPFYEQQVKRISAFYRHPVSHYYKIEFNVMWMAVVEKRKQESQADFATMDLKGFSGGEEAYHQLMYDIALSQAKSLDLILKNSEVNSFFVDGGFSTNPLYMNMIAFLYPEVKVYAASMPQGSALGAALVIHSSWNSKPLPSDLVTLKSYSGSALVRE
jgi:sugar (pentulose or hexulose) kinase